MSHRERAERFGDKVRAAYLEVFGDNPFKDTDADPNQPFVIGPVLVAFETHLADDPDAVVSVVYDATTVSALGLVTHAQRLLLDNLNREEHQ